MTKNITYIAADGLVWDNKAECKIYERVLLNKERDYEALSNSLSIAPIAECTVINILNAKFFNDNRDFFAKQFNVNFNIADIEEGLYTLDTISGGFEKIRVS